MLVYNVNDKDGEFYIFGRSFYFPKKLHILKTLFCGAIENHLNIQDNRMFIICNKKRYSDYE